MSKYTLWVYRFSNKEIKNSKPCNHCCNSLRKLGFRKIGYSNNNGDTIIEDLRFFTNKHISSSQKLTSKYSKL